MKELIVISLGGSMIINGTGVHVEFIKKFKKIIQTESKKGFRFEIIAGGGNTARVYQAAGRLFRFSDTELDVVGIAACQMNGEFLKSVFKDTKGVAVVFGGKPGESSDGIATRHALAIGAKKIINISSTAYVYDSDPQKNPSAVRYEYISWKMYREIVGSRWVPGMHAPFDPTASKLAEKNKLKVFFVGGNTIQDLSKVLQGKKWNGSLIEN